MTLTLAIKCSNFDPLQYIIIQYIIVEQNQNGSINTGARAITVFFFFKKKTTEKNTVTLCEEIIFGVGLKILESNICFDLKKQQQTIVTCNIFGKLAVI